MGAQRHLFIVQLKNHSNSSAKELRYKILFTFWNSIKISLFWVLRSNFLTCPINADPVHLKCRADMQQQRSRRSWMSRWTAVDQRPLIGVGLIRGSGVVSSAKAKSSRPFESRRCVETAWRTWSWSSRSSGVEQCEQLGEKQLTPGEPRARTGASDGQWALWRWEVCRGAA